ncbi:MAG: nuclear transport factor 2 family protein [Candidatus Binatia bacterium]
MTTDRAAVEAIEALRAQWDVHFNAGRIAELANLFYTDDAVALPPDTPHITGRANIRAFFQSFYNSGKVEFHLGVIRTEAAGNYGYLVGDYTLEVTASGRTQRFRGETNEAYRKLADGRWQCCADMWHNVEEL